MRVVAFTDGVIAMAVTLLVLGKGSGSMLVTMPAPGGPKWRGGWRHSGDRRAHACVGEGGAGVDRDVDVLGLEPVPGENALAGSTLSRTLAEALAEAATWRGVRPPVTAAVVPLVPRGSGRSPRTR